MFLKPFKVKSNHQLKVSDKKHLREEFKKNFPNLTDENLDEALPKKELVVTMKIETATNAVVYVYVVNKRAIAFSYEGVLYPTIYFLWLYPDIAISFTTHGGVLPKLIGGAHLMLPGVVHPVFNLLTEAPKFYGKARAYVNLTSNRAAVAVGITAQSSVEMVKSDNKGKCVIIYHVLGDKLCTLENLPCLPVPDLGWPEWMAGEEDPTPAVLEDGESFSEKENINSEELDVSSQDMSVEESASVVPATKEMDDLFRTCFLSAIKYSKGLAIPILISTFYKVFMIPACPSDKVLDIKKSSYKKFSQFLQSMIEVGVIKVEEQKKGVNNISVINQEHPMVVSFNLHPSDRPAQVLKEGDDAIQPSVVEAHSVTAIALPVFAEFGFIKGSVITNSEIRKYINEYVKKHNLQSTENKNNVNLDIALRGICPNEYNPTWQKLMEKVYNCMSPCYKITCGGTITIRKGKLESINITIAKRSGNKKITLVDNLEVFGICIEELATYCQRGVAASTNINRSETAKKTDQLQIQGNQVLFVYNALTEKYKVPKKYIKGLEFAPKKKN